MLDRWPNKCNTSKSLIFGGIRILQFKNLRGRTGQVRSLQSRIDYWLISDPLSENISTVKMLPKPLTDHKKTCIIFLELCGSTSHQTKRVNSFIGN